MTRAERLETIRARMIEAIPDPRDMQAQMRSDARFIAIARADVPWLLDEVARLEAVAQALAGFLNSPAMVAVIECASDHGVFIAHEDSVPALEALRVHERAMGAR